MSKIISQINSFQATIGGYINDLTADRIHQFIERFERKIGMHFTKCSPGFTVSKGSIIYVELGINVGSEIFKTRPCVVVSPSIFNKGNTVLVAPLTGLYNDLNQKPKKTSSHQYLVINPDDYNNLNKPSIINLGQIRCISKKRIGNKKGRLCDIHMDALNKKLKRFFGL